MDLGSTPNDLMQNLSTVFMLAFIPLLDRKFECEPTLQARY